MKRNNSCAQNSPNNRVGLTPQALGQMTPLITTDKYVELLTLILLTGNHFFCLLPSHFHFSYFRHESQRWTDDSSLKCARHVSQGSPPFSTYLDLLFLGCVPFFFLVSLFVSLWLCPFLCDIILDLHLSISYFMYMLMLNYFYCEHFIHYLAVLVAFLGSVWHLQYHTD